jgi:ABC-type glycerol-3-phosphate transport system substrate-binding protein
MKKISIFQIVVIMLSGLFAVIALILFSTYKGEDEEKINPVTVWGTIDYKMFKNFQSEILLDEELGVDLNNITYEEKRVENFNDEFIEALATGVGPDLVILPHNMILLHQNKLLPLSYDSYPERLFKDSFIDGADVLRDPNGIYALPLVVDPLVMYWNKDLFKRELITEAPKTWETLIAIAPKLSISNDSGTISRSAVAFGQFFNTDYPKEIFTTLMQQAGSKIVKREAFPGDNGVYEILTLPVLSERDDFLTPPAEAALRFFGQFTDPTRDVYSWNRSLSQDSERFLSGDLAIYFGKTSKYDEFKKINPNLNFDVAVVPQKAGAVPVTYADFTAIGIVKNTKKSVDAFKTISVITKPEIANLFSDVIGLPPARRDVLGYTQSEAQKETFFASAVWAKAFYDPYPEKTNKIFKDMVELYTSGQVGLSEAIGIADEQLEVIFR